MYLQRYEKKTSEENNQLEKPNNESFNEVFSKTGTSSGHVRDANRRQLEAVKPSSGSSSSSENTAELIVIDS